MGLLGLRKAGSFLSTTTCVTTETTVLSRWISCKAFSRAFWSQKPMLPSVIATSESRGKAGFFSEFAARCWRRRLPTCGPLPWVIINSSPFWMSFTRWRAVSARAASWAWADGSVERMAFPPRATTILRWDMSAPFFWMNKSQFWLKAWIWKLRRKIL